MFNFATDNCSYSDKDCDKHQLEDLSNRSFQPSKNKSMLARTLVYVINDDLTSNFVSPMNRERSSLQLLYRPLFSCSITTTFSETKRLLVTILNWQFPSNSRLWMAFPCELEHSNSPVKSVCCQRLQSFPSNSAYEMCHPQSPGFWNFLASIIVDVVIHQMTLWLCPWTW